MAKAATDDINQNNSGEVGRAKAKSKCIMEHMRNKGIEKAEVAHLLQDLWWGERRTGGAA